MGLIATHEQRARNMRVARYLMQPAGWIVLAGGVLLVVAAFAGDLRVDAVITGVLFAAFGAGMVAVSRRSWRLENAGYRPPRLFYAGATSVTFMIAAAMFVGAVFDESARGFLILGGLYFVAMGVVGVIRTVRGA